MNNFLNGFLVGCVGVVSMLSCAGSAAASGDPCALVGNKKKPIVILLDPSGNISKGPINLGGVTYGSDFEAEFYRIPTGYKVVAYPRSLFFDAMVSGFGYVNLEKIKAICSGASAYEVILHMTFDKRMERPFDFKYGFPNVMVEDLPSTPAREANEFFFFRPEISGTIIKPMKSAR